MAINVMLDLETLSSKSNAAIVAIGAVAFDKDRVVDDPFYAIIDPNSAEKFGHISASTFAWWCQQSVEARAMFATKGVEMIEALAKFNEWCQSYSHHGGISMWGNGSDFDNVILANTYAQTDFKAPWKFSSNRCFRTLKSLVPAEVQRDLWNKASEGLVHHNAVHDAKRQALMAIEIMGMVLK